MVLRLLILKHVRDWSYEVLEREVRANLVYRTFARIGAEKVPDAKTLGRLAQVVGPEVIADLHQRMVEIAMENKVVAGKRMRVDTTVVETNIHYPTDSSLLGDGTRVLTRVMKKAEEAAGGLIGKVRDRMRTVRRKVMAIAIAARQKGAAGEEKRRHIYKGLLSVTRKVVNQAKRVMGEVDGMARCRKQQLSGLRTQRATMVERVEQVIRQTRERVFGGNTKFETKLVSVFEPQTEIIQGQGEQAYGVRQAGQDPGSRESDLDAFRSTRNDPRTRRCWWKLSKYINSSWVRYRIWLRRMPGFIRSPTRSS